MSEWETTPAPNYPKPNYEAFGNALSNLFTNYQQSQENQQQIDINKLRQQRERQLLDQSKVFAGGVPMNKDGTPDYSQIMQSLARAGDVNAIGELAPAIQDQKYQGDTSKAAKDPLLGGGGSSGPSSSASPGGGGFMGSLHSLESGNQNVLSSVDKDPSGPNTRSQGYDQIDVPTWRQFAPQAGVDISQYPTPMSAPEGVQDKVASVIPLARFGPRTRQGLESQYGFGEDQKGQTIGQLAGEFGGLPKAITGASQDGQDALAYASDDKPSIPPVSASAGSSIPRVSADAGIGVAANSQQAINPGNQTALNNARNIPDAGLPGAGAPSPQTSVSGMVSGTGLPPQRAQQIAGLVSKVLRVPADAPLSPDQAAKAQKIIANAARMGQPQGAAPQQTVQAGPVSPQQQQQTQQGGGGSIVPQFPLPQGINDPRQAIMAIDQRIASLSGNPRAAGVIKALEHRRDEYEAMITPKEVRPGQSFVDPRSGQTIYQAPLPGGGLSPAAVDQAAESYYQTGKFPTGLGRGMQGAANIQSIMDRAQDLHPDDPIDNWPARQQAFAANLAGERDVATRSAKFTAAANAASAIMPRVIEASKAVNRTDFPSLNRIIEAGKVGTGDPAMVQFGIAAESLARAYARALSPLGSPTVSDYEHGRDMLDKAWSQGQIQAAVDQMQKEIESEKKSGIEKTRKEFGLPPLKGEDDGASGSAAPASDQGLPAGWSVKVR